MAAQASLSTRRTNRILYLPSRARKLRLPWIPLTVVVVLLICSIFAPLLTPHDPSLVSIFDSRMAPGATWDHPLGTDILGRDILARLIFGARTAMFISLVALSAGAFVGSVLGLVAGYRGGWLDILIMRAADAALGFPTILVAMIVVTILGAGIENIILAVVLTVWARFARMIRGDVLYITFYILRNWTSSPLLGQPGLHLDHNIA